MNIAVINYNAGNIRSVVNALRRVGANPLLTDNPAEIEAADRVVLPGQGEAGHTMTSLREKGLTDLVRSLTQPVLGICIGQQLFCEYSEEGDTTCLGLFPGVKVRRFSSLWPSAPQKIPHIGWNTVCSLRSPIFNGIPEGSFMYFIHSFCCVPPDSPLAAATTEYGGISFCSALHKDNFYAVQFHPEKSGELGERILSNFLSLS